VLFNSLRIDRREDTMDVLACALPAYINVLDNTLENTDDAGLINYFCAGQENDFEDSLLSKLVMLALKR
jgi:hypothetical protein